MPLVPSPPPKFPTRGIWRHYKGGLYNVVGVARHHETNELGAVYHGLQPRPNGEVAMLNWRPLYGIDGWFTPLMSPTDGSDIERFVFVCEVKW